MTSSAGLHPLEKGHSDLVLQNARLNVPLTLFNYSISYHIWESLALLDSELSDITVVEKGQPPESYFIATLRIIDKHDSGGCHSRLFSRSVCL